MICCWFDGLIGWMIGIEGEWYGGWVLLFGYQFFLVGWDEQYGIMMFVIFNGVVCQCVEMLDGLLVVILCDVGSFLVCLVCVMEWVGDLFGDLVVDDEYFVDEVEVFDLLV